MDATGDEPDQDPGDGVCIATQETCTLRAAIQEANATNNEIADVIEFDIPGSPPHVIRPGHSLPEITAPVVIDGATEPDYDGRPVVEIDGTNAGNVFGLTAGNGGGLAARALAVVNFSRAAFNLSDDAGGNLIQGCYVGVRSDGVTAAGNNRGFFVGASAPNTTIGGAQTGEGNIISGNNDEGVDLTGAMTVQGNRIGVDANGNPMGNGGAGVENNADGATIGGTGSGEGNVIAHNGGNGVEIVDVTPPNVQNVIRGNQIFANGGLGIDLEGGTEDSRGRTENDAGDEDDGQNRLQNFPEFQSGRYEPETGTVTVTYLVPSDPTVEASGSSDYPLFIDFYVADADAEEGRVYLGTDTYSSGDPDDHGGCGSPPCAVTTTFTPQSSVSQDENIVATATDENGNTSEFSSSVALGPANDPPVAESDGFGTNEGQTLTVDAPGVLGNDTDPDGDDLTASLVSDVSDGSLTLGTDGSFEYTPNANFNGTDGFTYEAADGEGGTDRAEATITVNARPTASDDSDQTIEGRPITIDVLANDSDPDGSLDASTVQVQSEASNGLATGNEDGTITYAPDEGFVGADSYTYTVADDDGAESNEATVTVEVSSPIQNVEWSPEVPQRETPLDVEVSVSEGIQPTEAQLFYRRGGETTYQTGPLEPTGASTFVGTVPGAAVTARGIEFYVRLMEEDVTATFPENSPSEQPLYVPVQMSTLEAEVTLAPDQYRMISVPARLDDAGVGAVFEDDFGPNTRQDWRLLRWQPGGQQSGCGAGRYEEFTLASGPADAELGLGEAYWLIVREGGTFDVENARSIETEPVTLTLPPGWTQVANPHPYPVAWTDVGGRDALQNGSPHAYNPDVQEGNPYVPNVSILAPWAGYWVCNPEASPVEITIPPREASSPTFATAGEKTSSKDRLFERKLAYALQLKATLERNTEAEQKDVQNVVGVAPDATRSLGLEDVIEPPPVRDRLRLSIIEDSTRLAGSLRPEAAEGHAWNLEVSAPVSEKRPPPRTVRVQLEARGTRPSGFTRRLMDRDTGRRIPIEDGSFAVSLTEERPARHLRLIVGTENFAETEAEAIRPDRTGLRAVYPNPSRGRVSVDYQLKAAQRVRIRVYDVLGRRVETLVDERRPAGHHTVRWDGGSGAVASGLYIVRLEAGATSASRRVSIVR